MVLSKEISLSTQGVCDLINITPRLEEFVKNSKVKKGLVLVFCAHSTAGIMTIEYEEGILKDFCEFMEKLIPKDKTYYHDTTWGEANGFSHLRASLIGPSLVCPIVEGKLALGTWQQIVLCDFDRMPRERKVLFQIIRE